MKRIYNKIRNLLMKLDSERMENTNDERLTSLAFRISLSIRLSTG